MSAKVEGAGNLGMISARFFRILKILIYSLYDIDPGSGSQAARRWFSRRRGGQWRREWRHGARRKGR